MWACNFISCLSWDDNDDNSYYKTFLGHSGGVYNVCPDLDWINGQTVAGRFFEMRNIILMEAIRSLEAPGQTVGDHGNISLGH